MSTSTLSAILRALVDDYGLGRRGVQTGTVAGSFVSDADLGGPEAAKDISAGCQVLIDTADDRAGDVRNLSSKPKLSTGLANVDPDFGAALTSGDTFIVLYRPLRFEGGGVGVVDRVNQAGREFRFELSKVPVTLVTDGDMRASTEGSWTAIDGGGGANVPTLAKGDASFPFGERVLRVTNHATGAGDYALSATIAVEEKTSYYLEALGMIGSSGAAADAGTLVLYDETNSEAITLGEKDINQFEPELLMNNVTMPSGCEQVSIRLTCTAVDDIIEWGHVIFRKNSSRELVLVDRPLGVMKMGRLLRPVGSKWGSRGEWTEISAKFQALGQGMWKYTVEEGVSGVSLWYEEFARPASLSAGTPDGTTTIPAEDLAAVSAELILRPLRLRSSDWGIRYEFAQSRAAGVISRYLQQNQTVVNQASSDYRLLRA